MTELEASLRKLQQHFADDASKAADEPGLENVRITYLGRNGEVTKIRRTIGTLPPEERPDAGKLINDAVAAMEALLEELRAGLESRVYSAFNLGVKTSSLIQFFEGRHPLFSISDGFGSAVASFLFYSCCSFRKKITFIFIFTNYEVG